MSFLIFINMESKICCNCKLLKTVNEFHKNKSKKDGLQETCKECRKLSAQKNKEILSDYKKNWYQKNSEVRKKKANIRYSIKKDYPLSKGLLQKNYYHFVMNGLLCQCFTK